MLTAVPLSSYFGDKAFFEYFWNLIGYVHFLLPGVFVSQPSNTVNLQLWTVPYELECYIALAVVAVVGIFARRNIFLSLVAAIIIFLTARDLWLGTLWPLDMRSPGRQLVLAFLCGVLIFLYRDRLPFSRAIAVAALVLSWIALDWSETVYLAAIPVSYLTVFVGLQNPPRVLIIRAADYSYGIYLYGFSVQQAVYYLLPNQNSPFNFAVSLIATSVFAFLSWTYVEANVLKMRERVLHLIPSFPWGASRRQIFRPPGRPSASGLIY